MVERRPKTQLIKLLSKFPLFSHSLNFMVGVFEEDIFYKNSLNNGFIILLLFVPHFRTPQSCRLRTWERIKLQQLHNFLWHNFKKFTLFLPQTR